MNVGALKALVVPYLGKSNVSDLTVAGQDLVLHALNAARKEAELRHDFEYSRKSVDLLVDGVAGGALSSAVLAGTEDPVPGSIKTVERVGVVQNGTYIPLRFKHVKGMLDQVRDVELLKEYDDELRYPSDAHFTSSRSLNMIYQLGDRIYRYPEGDAGITTTLRLYVTTFLPDYSEDTDEDFFLQHGWNYLKWAAICELNHHFKDYVPREEGNLAPPTRERDKALEQLINWDCYLIEPNADHYA